MPGHRGFAFGGSPVMWMAAPWAVVMSILLSGPALGVCTEDPQESGDMCPSAPAIRDGDIQPRQFCEDAEDWAVFNACVGRLYVLTTANLGASADTILEMYGPDCMSLVAWDDNGGGGLASRIAWVAPASGIYHIRIRQADGSFGSDRGYDLGLSGDTSSCSSNSWTYSLATPGSDMTGAFISDGGTLAFYSGTTVGPRGTDTVLVRLAADGTVVWRESLGTATNETVIRAFQTADGFVVAGQTGSAFWISKLTPLGQIAWQRHYAIGFDEKILDVKALADGGFVVTGMVVFSRGIRDAFLLKLDPSGSILWGRIYDGSPAPDQTESDDRALAVRPTQDGGFVLLGVNEGFPPRAWLTGLTATGDLVWARDLGLFPSRRDRHRSARADERWRDRLRPGERDHGDGRQGRRVGERALEPSRGPAVSQEHDSDPGRRRDPGGASGRGGESRRVPRAVRRTGHGGLAETVRADDRAGGSRRSRTPSRWRGASRGLAQRGSADAPDPDRCERANPCVRPVADGVAGPQSCRAHRLGHGAHRQSAHSGGEPTGVAGRGGAPALAHQ